MPEDSLFQIAGRASSHVPCYTANEMRPLLLRLAGLALVLGVGGWFLPVERPVLSLQPSGDQVDQERFGGKVRLEQQLTLPAEKPVHGIEILFRPPIPPGGQFTVRTHSGSIEQTQTVSLKDIGKENIVRIPFLEFQSASSSPLTLLFEAKDLPENSIGLGTATNVPETFHGSLKVGGERRDRHIALTLYERVSAGTLLQEKLQKSLEAVMNLGATRLGFLIIGAAVGAGAFFVLRSNLPRRRFLASLFGLAVLSIVLHIPFLTAYPATNDEGSLLMDIQNIRAGYWPFRDVGATKGPLSLVLLGGIVAVTNHSLTGVRVAVAILTGVEVVLLGVLGRRLWGERAGILSAVLYAVTPVVLAQTTQLFLQPFALPFATLGLIVLVPGQNQRSFRKLLGAGALFGLAILARSTTAAFLPAALLFSALRETGAGMIVAAWRIGSVLAGCLGVVALAGLLALPFLGKEKTIDFLGGQGVRIGQERTEHGRAEGGLSVFAAERLSDYPRRIVQNTRPILYGGAPLLVLTLVFLLARLSAALRAPALVGGAVLLLIGASFFPSLKAFPPLQSDPTFTSLLRGGSFLLLLCTVLSVVSLKTSREHSLRDLAFILGTGIVLIAGYANFGPFRNHYHAEFLPLYALASAFVLSTLLRPRLGGILGLLAFLLCGALLGISAPTTLAHPHAGNIPLAVAREVAEDLRSRTSAGEEIFTAQPLFPFLADRFIPFGISHPGWYREESLGVLPPEIRRRYFPDGDQLRAYLAEKPVRVVVVERRTREVFLEFDPDLKKLLETDYRIVRTLQNPLLDSIEIWQRATDE